MKPIRFNWSARFGYTTLEFNGYKYGTYNEYLARLIIKKAERTPGKAWNDARKHAAQGDLEVL